MSGFVYAWKVPVVVVTTPDLGRELCIVKVGHTESHKLADRLYTGRLSWGKILGQQTSTIAVGTNELPIIDYEIRAPDIPRKTGHLDEEETMEWAGEVWEEMKGGQYPDFGFFLVRNEFHHINDDEQYIRALFGLPLRPAFVDTLMSNWNRCKKYGENRKRLGKIQKGQIGFSEYIITTVAQFKRVREAFIQLADFKDFSLDVVSNVLTPDGSNARHRNGVNISVQPGVGDAVQMVHNVRTEENVAEIVAGVANIDINV